jgi:Phage tail tube protein
VPFNTSDPNAFLGFGIQTAKGTPQVTPARLRYQRYLSGVEETPEQEIVDVREGGFGMDYSFSYRRKILGRGQAVFFSRPEILGLGLAWALGAATWGGGSSPATHIFHSNHASYPFSTLLAQHPGSDLAKIYTDARAAGFTLELSAGEPHKLTVPWTSLSVGASFAALTPTYYSEEPFMYFHAPTITLDGTLDTTVSQITFTKVVNLEELQAQAISLDEIVPQTRDIDVEVVRRYENSTLWKKVYFSGGVTPSWSVATGSIRGMWRYPGAPTPMFDIQAPLVTWRTAALTGLDPDGKTVYETLTGRALQGATHSLIAFLNNTHASAYA